MNFKLIFSALVLVGILSGCGTAPPAIDEETIKHATDNAKVVRGIFDASGGDYDKVPAGDKNKLIGIYKDDAGARKAFELIKHPPGGGPGAPMANQPKGN
jgi:hypothetical protein